MKETENNEQWQTLYLQYKFYYLVMVEIVVRIGEKRKQNRLGNSGGGLRAW